METSDFFLKESDPNIPDPEIPDAKASDLKISIPEAPDPENRDPKPADPEASSDPEMPDPEVSAQEMPALETPHLNLSDLMASQLMATDPKAPSPKTSDSKVSNRSDYFNCKEVPKETRIRSSWQFSQESGNPGSRIRVRNISTCIPVARDAWGREAQPQPVLISADVSLREPFESASAEDAVTKSTVHYGKLSKAIAIASTAFMNEAEAGNLDSHGVSLQNFLDVTARTLTTQHYPYDEPPNPKGSIVLPCALIKALELKIMLPKASLIGSGVSFTSGTAYDIGISQAVSMCGRLTVHELRIPTLIGVNPNERLAKQIVVANVEIDRWVGHVDLYNELEDVVVKASLFSISK
jgi:dihydroneopterin aldolase